MQFGTKLVIALALARGFDVIHPSDCLGQALRPTVFVANNGNCEGSVSSFIINEDGTAEFVQKIVTGTVPCGSGQTAPGLNAQAISISPSGKWLVTGHGTISSILEQLTFYVVSPDSTMEIFHATTTPDSPVDVGWIDDEYLAVTATPSGNDFVIIYKFDPNVPSITQHFYQPVASIFDFVIDHEHGLLYARDGTSGVTAFRINADRTLTRLNPITIPTGVFFLGPGLSPDGT